MATYLTKAILNGRGFSDELLIRSFGDVTTSLDVAIVTASNQVKAIVRGRLRNATEIGDTTTDEAIISATAAKFMEAMAARPETAFALPEGWSDDPSAHPDKDMLNQLIAGLQVSSDAAPSIAEAVKASDPITFSPSKTQPSDMEEWGY